MKSYGKELILDLHDCDPKTFTRKKITSFFKKVCKETDMQACDLHFWDYMGEPEEYQKAPDHIKGTTAVQFITTSNILIHTLDVLKKVYINFFSCKDFKSQKVIWIAEKWFKGKVVNFTNLERD